MRGGGWWVVGGGWVGGWLVQTNYIARLGLSQVSQSGPSVAILGGQSFAGYPVKEKDKLGLSCAKLRAAEAGQIFN